MKKWLKFISISLFLLSATAKANIAVVDIAGVFQKMPERDVVAKALDNEFADRIKELTNLENDIKSSMQKLQTDKLKATERASLEKSTEAKREKFTKLAESFERDNRKRQNEERVKLLEKIKQAVEEVAKQDKYSIVIDSSSVAYFDESTNITAKVLEKVK